MLKTNPLSSTIPAFVPNADAAGGIALADVSEPAAAPNEALVAVGAYSVNRGETMLLEEPRAGWRPGQDVAGRVLLAAADGSGPPVGARVVGHARDRGWATRVPIPTSALVELPEEVPIVNAATLPLAGLTALRMLRVAEPLDGRRMLLTGASGGVGHFAVELAAAAGARVTAVSATPERGERLRALGADQVVHRVADAEGPFDVVLESVGGASLPDALALLADDGLVLWFGQASRRAPALDFFALPPRTTIQKFTYWLNDEPDRVDLATLVNHLAEGRLHPEIGIVADWHETPEVLLALRDRQIRGHAVLTVEQKS